MPPKKKRKQSLEDAKTLKMINKPKRGDGHVLSSVLTTRLVPRQTVRGTLVVVKEESDLQVERRWSTIRNILWRAFIEPHARNANANDVGAVPSFNAMYNDQSPVWATISSGTCEMCGCVEAAPLVRIDMVEACRYGDTVALSAGFRRLVHTRSNRRVDDADEPSVCTNSSWYRGNDANNVHCGLTAPFQKCHNRHTECRFCVTISIDCFGM